MPAMVDALSTADAAPRATTARRRRGRLLAATAGLAVLLIPELAVLSWDICLPENHRSVRIAGANPFGSLPEVQLRVTAPPWTTAELVHGLVTHWLPPLPLYPGMAAHGRAAIPAREHLGGTDLSWGVRVCLPFATPAVALRLASADAATLLAPWTDLAMGPVHLRLVVSSARLSSGDLGGLGDLILVASGHLTVAIGSSASDVDLQRLGARITTAFAAAPGGWKPRVCIALAPLVVTGPQAAILGSEATRAQIEALINAQLATRLAGVVIPSWVPLSARVDATIAAADAVGSLDRATDDSAAATR
jgi:hypothetical protein